jgi:hypothetical protein
MSNEISLRVLHAANEERREVGLEFLRSIDVHFFFFCSTPADPTNQPQSSSMA